MANYNLLVSLDNFVTRICNIIFRFGGILICINVSYYLISMILLREKSFPRLFGCTGISETLCIYYQKWHPQDWIHIFNLVCLSFSVLERFHYIYISDRVKMISKGQAGNAIIEPNCQFMNLIDTNWIRFHLKQAQQISIDIIKTKFSRQLQFKN